MAALAGVADLSVKRRGARLLPGGAPRSDSTEEYERRLSTKHIAERWPRVTIVPATHN
jgi:hypothetical protein